MKKLIEALHVIQDECNSYVNREGEFDCESCPLSKDARFCRVTEATPNAWEINDKVQKVLL